MKDQLLKILKGRELKLCLLATASRDGKPQAAIVGYAVTDDFRLYMSTRSSTRKWKNIQENNRVSVVVGWSFSEFSVQIDGVARPVTSQEEMTRVEELFYTQNLQAKKFHTDDTVFIEVTPTWARLFDPTQHPAKAEEGNL